jgi:hypothetical protein
VRTARIAAQIRPISLRRIGGDAAAPDNLLPAHREHRRDAAGIRTIWIDREELHIGFDRVDLQHRRVGICDIGEVAQRSVADGGERPHVGRRQRASLALGHEKCAVDPRDIPGNFGALRELAHTQPNAGENVV